MAIVEWSSPSFMRLSVVPLIVLTVDDEDSKEMFTAIVHAFSRVVQSCKRTTCNEKLCTVVQYTTLAKGISSR